MEPTLEAGDRQRLVAHRGRPWKNKISTLLAFLAVASPAFGQREDRSFRWSKDDRVSASLVDVQVLVEGRGTPLYSTPESFDRRYFEALRGQRYALRVQNRTGERIGVLVAVDGLNVVNGERTALSNDEPMYVLDPWESATIRGWRTSLSHVREFVFVDETRSYANRTDQANGDMGWVRVLAFREQQVVTRYRPYSGPRSRHDRDPLGDESSEPAKPSPKAEGRRQELGAQEPLAKGEPGTASELRSLEEKSRSPQGLDEAFPGTGWGDRRRDRVRHVHFDPMHVASDHIVLRYEYSSGLVALGIFPDRDRLRQRDRGELSFARPPRR